MLKRIVVLGLLALPLSGCYDLALIYPDKFEACGDPIEGFETDAIYRFTLRDIPKFAQQVEVSSGCYEVKVDDDRPDFLATSEPDNRFKKLGDGVYLGAEIFPYIAEDAGFLLVKFDGKWLASEGREPVKDLFQFIFDNYYAMEPGAKAAADPDNPFADIGKEEEEKSTYALQRAYIQSVIADAGDKKMEDFPIPHISFLPLLAEYVRTPQGRAYAKELTFIRQ